MEEKNMDKNSDRSLACQFFDKFMELPESDMVNIHIACSNAGDELVEVEVKLFDFAETYNLIRMIKYYSKKTCSFCENESMQTDCMLYTLIDNSQLVTYNESQVYGTFRLKIR
jgi:hypothetical protein